MTPKERKACGYFNQRYSCAQSVFAAFHAEMGISEDLALKLMMPMGGGVSGLQEICGAFSGAAMALGMIRREVRPDDLDAKQAIYETVQAKAAAFKAQYGTMVCRELLERNDAMVAAARAGGEPLEDEDRPCRMYVRACARLVEEELEKG